MNRILITNSSGFIGSNLYFTLLDNYASELELIVKIDGRGKQTAWTHTNNDYHGKIYSISRDLNETSMLDQIKRLKIDTIFHTAGIAKVSAPSDDIFPANVQLTYNLLEKGTDLGCRFIFCSSSTVYGNGNKYVPFFEQERLKPTSFYGISKVMCEDMVEGYTKMGKINGVNLRLCANVGPNATHGLLKDLIRKVKDKSDSNLELFGNAPGSIKPFIHVEDTVKAMLFFAEENYVGAYNVANEDAISVNDVAEIVMNELGVNKKKVWLGDASTWAGDNKEFSMSNRKLLRTGFELKYPSSFDAIRATVRGNK